MTSANEKSHSTIQDCPQTLIDIDISPAVHKLLVGFDGKNPTIVDSLELESVENWGDIIWKSSTKEY